MKGEREREQKVPAVWDEKKGKERDIAVRELWIFQRARDRKCRWVGNE